MRVADEPKDEVDAPVSEGAGDKLVGAFEPDIEKSKTKRAHLLVLLAKERLEADRLFNAERAGLLVPRASVDAMMADNMQAIKTGMALAHRNAVATLPHPHRAGMARALDTEIAVMFSNLAAAARAEPLSSEPTKEGRGERRDQKKTRRASVSTAGKGRATPTRRRAKPKGKSSAK